jgi:3-oxoacyl-[acyl-carrier-protein] synthase III
MPRSTINGVRIAGIASAVPTAWEGIEPAAERFGRESAEKTSAAVGVQRRRVAPEGMCTSDLAAAAGQRLLRETGCEAQDIGGLIFISQTPDYVLPGTCHVLQRQLGLPNSIFALDVNLACSGYVYGLWLGASLILTTGKKVLVLVGDTMTRLVSPEDRSVALLFGDAAAATLLEPNPQARPMYFDLGADGSGVEHLIVKAGGCRQPRSAETSRRRQYEGENWRSDEELSMNGPEVFAFTLKQTAATVKNVLDLAGWSMEDIDAMVCHQSNVFMLEHLRKKLKVPAEKFVVEMREFGNTNSASIPMALTSSTHWRTRCSQGGARLLLCGYGAGFSWASAALELDQAVMPELVECEWPAAPALRI